MHKEAESYNRTITFKRRSLKIKVYILPKRRKEEVLSFSFCKGYGCSCSECIKEDIVVNKMKLNKSFIERYFNITLIVDPKIMNHDGSIISFQEFLNLTIREDTHHYLIL